MSGQDGESGSQKTPAHLARLDLKSILQPLSLLITQQSQNPSLRANQPNKVVGFLSRLSYKLHPAQPDN